MPEPARSEHFLVQIDRLIDWAPLAPLMKPVGGPAHTSLSPAVVKMLLLARWYGMSEAALLEACQDRMSFRRFLGLSLADTGGGDELGKAFRQQTAQGPMESQALIHAIEAQLLAKGFSIRPGIWADAIVVPVAAKSPRSPMGRNSLAETAIFQPGELQELIKPEQSILVRSGARMVAENLTERSEPAALQAPPEPDAAPLQARLDWPWGASIRLGERLIVGRDHGFCPCAAELMRYPHVSRKHAELTVCPLGVWVRDLLSRNGTFVNDERLPRGTAYLVDADAQLRFGPDCLVQLTLEA